MSQAATSNAKSGSGAARTYANAVFEVAFGDWLKGLQNVATALDRNPNLMQTLTDASKGFEVKQTALVSLLPDDLAKPIRNFLFGMLANGDMALLPDVLSQLRRMVTPDNGQQAAVAEITSALELTEEERHGIEQRLREQFGAGLDYKFNVDPALLGGLVVRVGDKLVDDSIASRLAALRQSLGISSR
ncbi:MAG: ATP synthase F1 subunit delta [Anaerolineae bacterium]